MVQPAAFLSPTLSAQVRTGGDDLCSVHIPGNDCFVTVGDCFCAVSGGKSVSGGIRDAVGWERIKDGDQVSTT